MTVSTATPDNSALLEQGIQHHKHGRLDLAEQCYRQVLARQANNGAAAHYLGLIARENGKLKLACQFFHQALAHCQNDATLHYNLGLSYQQLGHYASAMHHYRQAIAIQPDFPQPYNNLAVLLNEAGDHQLAISLLKKALQIDPQRVESYYNLAYTQRFINPPPEIGLMQSLLENKALSRQEYCQLNFALGKIHDDLGQHAQAFTYFKAANSAKQAKFDPGRLGNFIDRLIELCGPEFFHHRSTFGNPDDTPVFIVGMPRSGTTLVEQILAAHPDVQSAGEVDYIQQVFLALPNITGCTHSLPLTLAQLKQETSLTLANDYLHQLRQHIGPAKHIIDKTPLNFLQLGLIALLFPNASIIHVQRDPRDTCLSCYFQNFSHNHDFAYSLEHLGLFHNQYRRLMAHWQEYLPLRMHELNYEQLIEQPEAEIRKLLAFCQLDWSPSCLHHSSRKLGYIKTASLYQARQPIYRHALHRWRHYRDYLGPLEQALNGTDIAADCRSGQSGKRINTNDPTHNRK